YVLVIMLVITVITMGTRSLGYYWQWYRVPAFLFRFTDTGFVPGPLLLGLLVTLRIAAVSLLLAFFFGLAAVMLGLSGSLAGRAIGRVYLELIRNTPLLIQLFFMYFVVSPLVGINAFTTAVLTLSLFEGAYVSEILRAGILSVDKGQWEASRSLGLGTWETYRFVILPQAFVHVLPPLTSQSISLIKDTALVSTIAIYDLTMQGQAIVAETFLSFEVWFVVAAMYLAVTLSLSVLVNGLERRIAAREGS
ncbi:amino acid ABC transporter permease, partial [bacterium]|nr:amino acid ABC transporter permease [bacterium]